MLRDAEPNRTRVWRAGFATILATAMATGTFFQFVFAVLAPFLIREFDITRSQLGLLTTASFAVGALTSLPAGRLVDRIGGRRLLVASMGIVAISTLGLAIAPAFGWMFASSMLGGVALALGNPVTNKLVAVYLPPGERGLIMGVKQSGVQVGAFAIGALLPSLASLWSWRVALAPVVAVPLIGIAAAWRIIPPDSSSTLQREIGPPTEGLSRVVRKTMIYGFLMGLGVAAVSSYLPLYAHDHVEMSVRMAGLVAATVGLVGILSRVAWGHVTERHGRFWRPLVIMGAGSTVSSLLILAADSTGPALLWVAAGIFGATAITWNTVGMLFVLSEVEIAEAGRASGWVLLGFYGGFATSPGIFGYSVDVTEGYALGWTAVTVIFVAATAVAALEARSRHRQRSAAPR